MAEFVIGGMGDPVEPVDFAGLPPDELEVGI